MQIDLTGISVFVAIPTTRDFSPQAVNSLMRAANACWRNGVKFEFLIEPGVSDVCVARSFCAHRFLHQSEASVLFWIDSDIVYSPEAFMRTLALTTQAGAVCGSYSEKTDPLHFMLNVDGPFKWNEYGVITNTSGGPIGFSAVNREVVKKLAEKAPARMYMRGNLKDTPIRQIFKRGSDERGYDLSEDTMFFKEVRELGYEVWCDPSLVIGHVGSKVYGASLMDFLEQTQGGNDEGA